MKSLALAAVSLFDVQYVVPNILVFIIYTDSTQGYGLIDSKLLH